MRARNHRQVSAGRAREQIAALVPARFRLRQCLGEGGQGSVYLATDLHRGGRPLALKAVIWSGDSAAGPSCLPDEFLTLSRLAHPSIARVFDFGYLAGGAGAYYTSDYVFGDHLLEWCAGQTGDDRWESLSSIAAQALATLRYLERKGIQHGDIKPQNLLVETVDDSARGPRLRLVDFGSARLREGPNASSAPLVSTRAYLPPPGVLGEGCADADLYGLGMSVFHAIVGHLPFALGEESALQTWWSSREAAVPSRWNPDVPAVLDDLVRRLTSLSPEDRFRNARDALEFLGRRIPLPPPEPGALEGAAGFYGRDELMEELLRLPESLGPGAILLAGAPGSGRSRLLDYLRMRAQVRGMRATFLSSPEDLEGLAELLRLTRVQRVDRPTEKSRTTFQAIEVASRLEEVTFLLVDDSETRTFPPLLGELVRCAAEDRRRGKRLVAVLATSSPESVGEALGMRPDCFVRLELEPLARAHLEEMARDYFRVDSIPGTVLSLLEESSSGMPAAARSVLDQLAASGVAANLQGELELPRALPRRVKLSADVRHVELLERLPARLRRQFALLQFARASLSPEEAASLFPQCPLRKWRLGMDGLSWRGFLTRYGPAQQSRHAVLPSLEDCEWSGRLKGAEAGRLRREVLRRFDSREGASLESPEVQVSRVRHLLSSRQRSRAIRAALRAARLYMRGDRLDEARRVLEEALRGTRATAERARLLARLRVADLCLATGRAEEGCRWLGAIRESAPRWYALWAHHRKGLLLESRGDASAAARELERLRSKLRGAKKPRGRLNEAMLSLEVEGRLARLYFQLGRQRDARRKLLSGRRFLGAGVELRPVDRATSILGVFASSEIYHGDGGWAARYLERALELARGAGREDLEAAPLNHLAVLHAGKGRLADALGTFQELEALARRRGDRLGELQSVYNQAHTCFRLERWEDAEELHRRACRLSDNLGRHAFSATVWIGLAVLLRERGRPLEALRLYRRVLRLSAVVRRNDRILARNNLGELYLLFGRPQRSLEERRKAAEEARQLGNAFLLGLALRGLGATLWALGRADDAEKVLRESLEIEEGSSDPLHVGGAHYFLGCIEAGRGRRREAMAAFRRARFLSRRQGDRRYEEAATLAILEQLVRAGRRRAADRILARCLDSRRGEPVRFAVSAKALGARASPEWPERAGPLFAAVREAESRGELWSAFLALSDALRDPLVPPDVADQLSSRQHLMLVRLSRGLSPADTRRLRRYWRCHEPPGRREARPAAREPGTGAETNDALAWSEAILARQLRGELEPFRSTIEELLGALARSLRAEGVWTINDPSSDSPFYGARGGPDRPSALLEARADLLDEARRRRSVVRSSSGLLASLGPSGRRFLFAEAPRGGWRDQEMPGVLERFQAAAAAISLLFELESKERDLAREQTLHRAVRDELRRLSAIMVKDKELLDTALISRRVELVEAARGFDEDHRANSLLREPVAESPAMRKIMDGLPQLAQGELPVLILGESGVGKDLVARWIHYLSPRRAAPFLAEICTLPESLLEAELFGYVRGAFTGAFDDRPGLFQRVNEGTLYLDEISDLSPAMQARLLRVLDSRAVRPLGSEDEVELDFRLISSSRAGGVDELRSSGLRGDLFYRLQGQVILIPPLRERPADIEALTRSFLADHAQRHRRPSPYLPPESLEKLRSHSWPGNIRELRNELERALVEDPREILPHLLLRQPEEFPSAARAFPGFPNLRAARDAFERDLVIAALREHRGNASRAARALGVTRRHLGKLLDKHGIDLSRFKGRG